MSKSDTGLGPNQQLMGGEYRDLTLSEITPLGMVYAATDPLKDPHWITEFAIENQTKRGRDGAISPIWKYRKDWPTAYAAYLEKTEALSRLSHPALEGIVQKFSENGTSYVATARTQAHTLDQKLAANGFFYQPREVAAIATSLIDLLAYLHAFGIYGLHIQPQAIGLFDDTSSAKLLLRRYIDGTLPYTRGTQDEVQTDCAALARSLHVMITQTEPPSPYVPIADKYTEYPGALLHSVDKVLSADTAGHFASAHDWLRFAKNPSSAPLSGTPPTKSRSNLWIGLAALIALFIAGPIAYSALTKSPAPVATNADQDTNNAPTNQDPALSPELADAFLSLDLPNDQPRVVPTPDALSVWQIELPLTTSLVDGKVALTQTRPSPSFRNANPWFKDGTVLVSIDGTPATPDMDLQDIILQKLDSSDAYIATRLTVHDPVLPLARKVALRPIASKDVAFGPITLRQSSGLRGWTLSISKIADGFSTGLSVGDMLVNTAADAEKFARTDRFRDHLMALSADQQNLVWLPISRSGDTARLITVPLDQLLTPN